MIEFTDQDYERVILPAKNLYRRDKEPIKEKIMLNLEKEGKAYEKLWKEYENVRLALAASGLSPAECKLKLKEFMDRPNARMR